MQRQWVKDRLYKDGLGDDDSAGSTADNTGKGSIVINDVVTVVLNPELCPRPHRLR